MRSYKESHTLQKVRRGFLSVPHVFGGEDGEPLDTLITNAFEATWQPVDGDDQGRVDVHHVRHPRGFLLSQRDKRWLEPMGRPRAFRQARAITKATDVMPYINRWAKAKPVVAHDMVELP